MNKHRNGIINHMVHFAFIFYLFNAQSVVGDESSQPTMWYTWTMHNNGHFHTIRINLPDSSLDSNYSQQQA